MGAPHRAEPVVQGEERVRVRGDVEDREVVGDERPSETGESGEVEDEEAGGRTRPDRHPARIAPHRPRERNDGQHDRYEQGEDEREVAELGDHGRLSRYEGGSEGGADPIARAISGGM